MLVVPAIVLRGGRCVRMKQGDPTTESSTTTIRSNGRRLSSMRARSGFT